MTSGRDPVSNMNVSLAVFSPQSKAPSQSYLDSIQSYLANHHDLRAIAENISTLIDVWAVLAETNSEIAQLSQAPRYVNALVQWLVDGSSEAVASISSGIVALPLLVIIQITQYFQYLESRGINHADFIAQVRDSGGIQGYCGGLPAAVAVASAKDEEHLIQATCTAIRLAYAMGVYAELGDDSKIPGTTTIVIRLKKEGQAEEIVKMFPQTHISAITDPKSVSIVGPVKQLANLSAYAIREGLQVQNMDIRGKVHNPENAELADALAALCLRTVSLDLEGSGSLQLPVRSNRTGEPMTRGFLTTEIVNTILASRCEWFQLLSNVAADLKRTGRNTHNLVSFGIGDCVPLMPFNRMGIQLMKTDWSGQKWNQSPRLTRGDISNGISYPEDAIAVIGASCRFPGANNLDELWDLISRGEDRHEEVKSDRFDLDGGFRASQSGTFTKNRKFYGNFIENPDRFDNAFFGINQREMLNMDPQQRVLLELSYEAMESSGYTSSHVRENGDNIGCFIGASFVEYVENTNSHQPTAYTSTGTIRAFLCGRLSYHFGWTGPAEVIDTACSSSLVAINRACKALQGGECSVALTGGIYIITGANNFLDLARAGFLSPTGQCKPFDQRADGYCRAEGAGLVVLKTLKQAQSDGDNIMAVISGAATNQGGLSCGLTLPDSGAQVKLFEQVLRQAAMGPEQVTYVEAHGTGTQAGDPVEIESVRSVFGSSTRKDELYIGSIKGNIGHSETAAGVAGLLKVISMLEHQAIPPQASHRSWNPKIPHIAPDRMSISKELRTWDAPARAAMVNSYGAAGSNAAILCCEAPKPVQGGFVSKAGLNQSIIISAASASSLGSFARCLLSYLQKSAFPPKLEELAYTLSEKRRRHKHFMTFEASSTSEFIKLLADDQRPKYERSTPNPVVLVFGGQSTQTIGLDKGFYENFTVFRTYINLCDDILQELGYPPILPEIFRSDTITDIVVLQTGFVAVQYASALTWIKAGLKISTVIGHSLGELTALAVSGTLALRDFLKLVAARADLMKRKWGPEKGAMLAVFASRSDVEHLLARTIHSHPESRLEIACYNSDTSQVVSGDYSAIVDLETQLASTSLSFKYLRVATSHGFHSRLVEPILDELNAISSSLDWKVPAIPVQLCSQHSSEQTGPYSPSDHSRNPVFYSDAVKKIEGKLGKCIWLEAGMNTPIISMTMRATSHANSHLFCAMTTREEQRSTDLISRMVCKLWQSSLDVTHWSLLEAQFVPRQVWLPPYQFDATKAWLANIDRAAELQRQLNNAPTNSPETQFPSPTHKLVSLLPDSVSSGKTKRFAVAVAGERFRGVVSGHSVRSQPLCPASFYLECAAMAIDILDGDLRKSHLAFESLDIQAPLGVAAKNVEVILQALDFHNHWEFSLISRHGPSLEKITLHAKGLAIKCPESRLNAVARLLGKRMEDLASNEDAERILSKRAYDLFSRVVTYEKFLKGITHISLSDTEAVAKITIPNHQPGLDETTVAGMVDAVSMDNFIQVVGLLMNTSSMVGDKEVMVCNGIETSMISKHCSMASSKSWKVYASYTQTSPSQALGDVFAFSETDSLEAAFTGCQFSKVDVTRLERLLAPVNHTPASEQTQKIDHSASSNSRSNFPTSRPELVTDSSNTSSTGDELRTPESFCQDNLRDMLETYTGIAASTIRDDVVIADLGLDSLAATELAAELQASNETSIDSQEMLSMTVKELEILLYARSVGKQPLNAPGILSQSSWSTLEINHPIHQGTNTLEDKIKGLLEEITGTPSSSIQTQMTLQELGVDSLALTEMMSSFADMSSANLTANDVSLQSTVEEVFFALGVTSNVNETEKFRRSACPTESKLTTNNVTAQINPSPLVSPRTNARGHKKTDPVLGLRLSNTHFDNAARNRGFQNYWEDVATKQDLLVLAYILEAFKTLGVDFQSLKEGDQVPNMSYQPKHSNVVKRLWNILEKHNIIKRDNTAIVRGPQSVVIQSSSILHHEFMSQHCSYAIEAQLLALTGSKLADCLKGTADPIKLLFGNASAEKILDEYYTNSPMLATLTEQLVVFIMGSIGNINVQQQVPLRILEVGAGTGGTTSRLAERLAVSGLIVEYTFSDVSSTMLSKAKRLFANYGWMDFKRLDLEQAPPTEMKGKFDIIIGTNCVHATSSKVATTSRIREMLKSDGFMVLSEVTRIIDWYDLVFGMLDGWWLADGGSSYPLVSSELWMDVFREAGFASGIFSEGSSEDSNTQQLLVGSNRLLEDSLGDNFMKSSITLPSQQTVVYKQVDGLQIQADIFLPNRPPSTPMPVALMLHGGGHMTLSRKAIRPAQTMHLLANGILPISLDYRLCPEVNLIDGAMRDVCDAFSWVRNTLPSLLSSKGITVDSQRIVVIGWSTGGHLALSTAWTVGAMGQTPPRAILVFYAPVDFISSDAFSGRPPVLPHRLSKEQILKTKVSRPISSYDFRGGEASGLGWIKSGDPRSELLLTLFRESREYGLSLLLNSENGKQGTIEELVLEPPSFERQTAICPTSQLMAGNYNVPTYIIHGRNDEIASFKAASKFYDIMAERGIRSGFLEVENVPHIHDLFLKPGMAKWDEQVAPGYQFLFDVLSV